MALLVPLESSPFRPEPNKSLVWARDVGSGENSAEGVIPQIPRAAIADEKIFDKFETTVFSLLHSAFPGPLLFSVRLFPDHKLLNY